MPIGFRIDSRPLWPMVTGQGGRHSGRLSNSERGGIFNSSQVDRSCGRRCGPGFRGTTGTTDLGTTENGAVMSQMSHAATPAPRPMHGHASAVLLRSLVIGSTAFLTVVDL